MTVTRSSPARFIVFLALLAVLLGYIVMQWDAFHERTSADRDAWESSPVVVVEEEGEDAAGAVPSAPAGVGPPLGDMGAPGAAGPEAVPALSTEVAAVEEDSFFARSRLERERARAERIELLQQLAENPDLGEDARARAEEELIALSRRITQEAEIEGLVRARGFAEALAYLYEETAVVIVQGEALTQAQAAQIADAVAKVARIPFAGISVMARPD